MYIMLELEPHLGPTRSSDVEDGVGLRGCSVAEPTPMHRMVLAITPWTLDTGKSRAGAQEAAQTGRRQDEEGELFFGYNGHLVEGGAAAPVRTLCASLD